MLLAGLAVPVETLRLASGSSLARPVFFDVLHVLAGGNRSAMSRYFRRSISRTSSRICTRLSSKGSTATCCAELRANPTRTRCVLTQRVVVGVAGRQLAGDPPTVFSLRLIRVNLKSEWVVNNVYCN
jgi:hypothetical protein